jgi:hypothetical protein
MAKLEATSGNTLLQLFAKHPVEGEVKTRLIPKIGAINATRVYLRCLQHCLELLDGVPHGELWLNRESDHDLIGKRNYHLQQGGTLGDKMLHALSRGLKRFPRVILIGSDCLDLQAKHISRVSQQLLTHDLVLIPAVDGGYVLIGVREKVDGGLFQGIDWSTEKVLQQTLERARQSDINCCVLNPLRDIDQPADLQHYPQLTELLD